MEYSFVNDPELRDRLEKARKNNKKKILEEKIIDTNLAKEDIKVSGNSSEKNKSRPNKKFENLKSKKRTKKRKRLKPPSTKSLAVSTKQLSSMLRTGLPLLEALNIISDSNENKTLKEVFREASIGISRGSTLQENLQRYPYIFDEMYIALVSAGETAGLLPEVLDREAKLLESLSKIKAQIKSALTYPIAIFVLTAIVIVIMLVFVIPIFVDMYASSSAPLPGITQLLVNASNLIKNPSFLLKAAPVVLISFFIIKKQIKTSKFIGFYICLNTFYTSNNLNSIFLLVLFSLSWSVGLVVPTAPGGVGVFEACFLFFVGKSIPQNIILICLIYFRVISTSADLLLSLPFLIRKLSKRI